LQARFTTVVRRAYVMIEPEASTQKIGWSCLTMLLRNEREIGANIPEGVHQMRVAIRRLRSVVNAVKRMLLHEQYGWVDRELKWLANILRPARNWDVFSSDILAPISSSCSANGIWRVFPRCRARAPVLVWSGQWDDPVAAVYDSGAESVPMVRLLRLEGSTRIATMSPADGADRCSRADLDRAPV